MDTSLVLDGDWDLSFGEQSDGAPRTPADLAVSGWRTVPAKVPGNVELDLAAAGLVPQKLHLANSIYRLREIERYRWFYRRAFAGPSVLDGWRAVLVFEGIDCLGEVFLNGESLGHVANMLVAHEFDVTRALRIENNELVVRIDSAVREGERHRPEVVEFGFSGNWESLSVRKAPHMYGWDILPRIISAGLWRGVRIELRPPVRIGEVYVTTTSVDAAARRANVQVDWQIGTDVARKDGWKLHAALSRGGTNVCETTVPVLGTHGRMPMRVDDAALWWPRGSGDSTLHELTLTLIDGTGATLATHALNLGLRTIELRRTDVTDETGGEFVFVVNGRKIYCRGTNHVPLDALHSRDPQHLASVLPMLLELNCNMVRCWGGNVYEDHAFFDFCDRNGVMVWQDFAMACAIYPQTAEFAAVIRKEAEAVVRKLRNHPSLALWAGNNEIDQAYEWPSFGIDPNTDIHSRQVLPDVVRRLDPVRPYLPSSPYYSPEYVKRGRQSRYAPEDHLWGPRDDFRGSYYTSSNAHFVSEIGYHGCPDIQTMREMMDEQHLWPWQDNDQWLTHAVRPQPEFTSYNYRIPLMAKQIRVLFDSDPQTLEEFIFASQASQAEAMKFFVERWRMGKWRRTGMLWWNLRDGWPVISDAVVDYFGRRKLAYDVLKVVQADICVCLDEPANGKHAIRVVSDAPVDHELEITVRALGGTELLTTHVCAKADSVTPAGEIAQSCTSAMWLIEWRGTALKGVNHYLAGPRPTTLSAYREWYKHVKAVADRM